MWKMTYELDTRDNSLQKISPASIEDLEGENFAKAFCAQGACQTHGKRIFSHARYWSSSMVISKYDSANVDVSLL